MGRVHLSLSDMVDFSAVEEAHSLGANILNELNKLKPLTAPKKVYFGESVAHIQDSNVRQHAWFALLDRKASQKGGSRTGKIASKVEEPKDTPRPDDFPKEVVPPDRSYSEDPSK